MLTHVVLFNPQPPFTPEEEARFVADLEGFTRLDVVLEAKAGPVVRGAVDQFSHMVVMRFATLADLTESYVPHPEHQVFVEWIASRATMATFDLEHDSISLDTPS